MPTRRLIPLLSILLLSAAAQAAPDNWLPQAQRMNREIVRKEDRRARLHEHFRGSLSQGESKPQQINLRAGKHLHFLRRLQPPMQQHRPHSAA